MRVTSGAIYLTVLLFSTIGSAVDLKQSRFSQVINDVKVLEMSTKKTTAATVNEIFNLPDMIRTGPGSRAELIAEDRTITRIGANSIFSFDPSNRTISLEKGSLLFQAPKGKGGGTIRTTSAAASVLGTTMIVAATDDGGFKVLLLEGSGKVKLPNGKSVTLKPGQMVFVLPNDEGFSPVLSFALGDQVEGSLLVNGFDNELPSMDLITLEITRQNKLIANGRAVDTGLLIGDNATLLGVQVIDPNLLQDVFQTAELHAGDGPAGPGHGPTDPGPTDPGVIDPGPVDPGPVDPGPVDPGPVDPGPVDPEPTIFDIIIGSAILDDEDLQHDPEFGFYMEGNNVLVDAETVDMSVVASDYDFFIDAANIMQFADNPSHSTAFLGGGSVYYPTGGLSQALAEGGVYELYLTAGDFLFPNDFTLTFDGYVLSLKDLNDMNLSSTSANGLSIETLSVEGRLQLESVQDMNLTGNVRLYADTIGLVAGNNLTMDGGYLGFAYNANLSADGRLTMRNVGFGGGGGSISMAAKTIVLEDILFPSGSFVYMETKLGVLASKPNTKAPIEPGKVNFYHNVFYGNTATPAQNEVDNHIIISQPSNPAGRR